MRSRTRKRYAASLAAVAALALSGCSLHPGSAAVVNGSNISESRIDNLVLAACSFQHAGRIQRGTGDSPTTSMAYLRHVLLQDLITFKIADKAVKVLGLSVSPAAIAKGAGTVPIPPGVSSSDREILQQFFTDSGKSQVEQAVIGAHIKDPSVTNADNVTQTDISAAEKYLTAFTARQDVQVNPAYGSWNGAVLIDGDGSLSAPQSSDAVRWLQLRKTNSQNVEGLPPSQVCG